MEGLAVFRFGAQGIGIRFAEAVGEESLARCRGLLRWLDEHPPEGLREVIPAYGEILLDFAEGSEVGTLLDGLPGSLAGARPLPASESPLHEIDVIYDGPDLAALAERNRLSSVQVVELHAHATYTVYLVGFSPGFPYLGPLDPRLHAPRRSSPRPWVPAGSVAIGGEHTGIYSIASPGGWWLIGRTDFPLFDLSLAAGRGSAKAFSLRPGDRVKFRPITL